MKKYLIFLFSLLVSFGFSTDAFASENNATYDEAINNGYIDSSISEELWNQAIQENEKSRKEIENNSIVNKDQPNWYASVPDTGGSFAFKKGDIVVTNHTSSAGLSGHAGIAISSSKVLHIPGIDMPITVDTLSSFLKKYKKNASSWIAVYRSGNTAGAARAADWVNSHYGKYAGTKTIKYSILVPLDKDINPTYCSKIVWQGYKYGAGSSSIDNPATFLALPYSLHKYLNGSYAAKRVAFFSY